MLCVRSTYRVEHISRTSGLRGNVCWQQRPVTPHRHSARDASSTGTQTQKALLREPHTKELNKAFTTLECPAQLAVRSWSVAVNAAVLSKIFVVYRRHHSCRRRCQSCCCRSPDEDDDEGGQRQQYTCRSSPQNLPPPLPNVDMSFPISSFASWIRGVKMRPAAAGLLCTVQQIFFFVHNPRGDQCSSYCTSFVSITHAHCTSKRRERERERERPHASHRYKKRLSFSVSQKIPIHSALETRAHIYSFSAAADEREKLCCDTERTILIRDGHPASECWLVVSPISFCVQRELMLLCVLYTSCSRTHPAEERQSAARCCYCVQYVPCVQRFCYNDLVIITY